MILHNKEGGMAMYLDMDVEDEEEYLGGEDGTVTSGSDLLSK